MSPVIPSKRHLSLILILLLMVYIPSATALQAGYTARENPANVTATNGQVDYKTLAVMADMYLGIDKISLDLNKSDFDSAGIDYRSFRSLYDSNKDVILRLFDSNADALAALNSTDLTVDDIRAYIEAARDYNETYQDYLHYVAIGDRVNATASGIGLHVNYSLLSSAYDELQASSYVSMDRLDDSSQEGINASLLKPFIDASDSLMSQMAMQNQMIQLASGQYALTLSSESEQAQIGDKVVYTALLKSTSGASAQGGNIALYMDGVQVASGVTGESGECDLSFVIPDSLGRDRVKVYAEYLPPGHPELLAISDTLYLSIIDQPASLSLSVTPDRAAYGDTVKVTGRMTSGRGSPALDQPIDILINGVPLGEAMTGGDGGYTFSFPIAENTPGGECNITARYIQAPGDIFLSTTSPAGKLNVTPGQTSITLNIRGDNYTMGAIIPMGGRLVSENGRNVSGASVIAYLDGVNIGDELTDMNGSYNIQAQVPYDSTPGNHSIYAVYGPAGGSLSGSSSDRHAVHIEAIRTVLSVNGTPLVLFSNDTLIVTGSLHTDSGNPVGGRAVAVRVSDSIGGVVTTDTQGDFIFSRTVNSLDPAGLYGIAVSLPASGYIEPATDGYVLIVPADKVIAITSFAAAMVLLFIVVLLANAGMSLDKLSKLATGRLRIEADIEEKSMDEPGPNKPALPLIPGIIGEQIGNGSFREAAVNIYTAARMMAISRGVKVRDSDTHREFYNITIKSYPFLADHLRPILDTYERMRYGHMDASARDMQTAYGGLQAMQAEINRDIREDNK